MESLKTCICNKFDHLTKSIGKETLINFLHGLRDTLDHRVDGQLHVLGEGRERQAIEYPQLSLNMKYFIV